jgi:hypothetical protein
MTCSIPDCDKLAERSGKCATHARLERKAIEEAAKPVKTKKPIAKHSDKLAEALKEYAYNSKEWLRGQMCAVYPHLKATAVHHRRGRNTIERLLNEDEWLAVSDEGHNYIHAHPEESMEKGWMLKRSVSRESSKLPDFKLTEEPHPI